VALGAVEPTRMVVDAAQYCCASQHLLLLFWSWWMHNGAQEENIRPVVPCGKSCIPSKELRGMYRIDRGSTQSTSTSCGKSPSSNFLPVTETCEPVSPRLPVLVGAPVPLHPPSATPDEVQDRQRRPVSSVPPPAGQGGYVGSAAVRGFLNLVSNNSPDARVSTRDSHPGRPQRTGPSLGCRERRM